MHREDIHLSGSTTIVLLYEDEKFYVRLLRRGERPTYLTPKHEVPPDELKRFAKVIRHVGKARGYIAEQYVNWGPVTLIAQGDKIIAGREGNDIAEGFGKAEHLEGAIIKLLFRVLGEIV